MQNNTEEIKSRLDIAELIQGYVRLTKAGVNYKAPCPFHSEKTASFFVSPAKQIWHCFGCNRGGDHFGFVMEIEGIAFPEALKLLADRVGIRLAQENPAVTEEKNRLLAICEEATKFFEEILRRNDPVMRYLRERGLTDDTIKQFRIGYAPDEWRALFEYLTGKKYQGQDIEKAGLAVKSDKQGGGGIRYYDRFRGRVMFPINDANSRVIGFGGRIFSAKGGSASGGELSNTTKVEAKYINTPQTPIYDKSRVLYGFDKAKQEIRKKNACVLVEGYMDTVMSHQAGVRNAVAVSGTALTHGQLATIKRLAETLISSFDSDAAGEMATKRSLDLAASYDFTRKVAVVPKALGKDPADIVKENPEKWREIVDAAEPVMDFYFSRSLERYDATSAEGKKNIARALLPEIARITNEIERAHWVQKLASILKIPEEAIAKELVKQNEEPAFLPEQSNGAEPASKTRRELLEERLLGILASLPDAKTVLGENEMFAEVGASREIFSDPVRQELFVKLCGIEGSLLARDFAEAVVASYGAVEPYAKQLALAAEVFYGNADPKHLVGEAQTCFQELTKEYMKEKLQALARKIEKAESDKDAAQLESLTREFRELSQKLNRIG